MYKISDQATLRAIALAYNDADKSQNWAPVYQLRCSRGVDAATRDARPLGPSAATSSSLIISPLPSA